MLSLRYSVILFLVPAKCSLLSDILSAFETSTDCTSCHATLLPAVQAAAQQGDAVFISTLTTVCQTLKLADDDVCVGQFQRSGPVLAHSLRALDTTGTTATRFCDAVFGLCQPPPVDPFTVAFPKPTPAKTTKFVSRGRQPFQVVHFSDVHIDRQYTVGSDANCTKPICCRDFADHTGPVTDPAGPFGNAACDAPVDLAQSMLRAIASGNFGDPRIAVFTGDVVAHDEWIVDRSEATKDLVDWNNAMLGGLRIPVYPTLGNHDSAPVNSFPRSTTRTNLTVQWVFDIEQFGWEPWIGGPSAAQQERNSGSYAVVVPGTNLRIISINTQYWYKQNYWLYDTNTSFPDPNGVLAFMVQQLQAAEDRGQRAWLIGHIPPGKADTMHDQSNYYDQIVQRYKFTIAAQFFGHSHQDQFEIAYSNYSDQTASTADSIVFIGPALTPTSGNPAFKIYDVDPDTFEVMDAKVFITNTSDSRFQVDPTWELYYSARDSYGPLVGPLAPTDSLNASFWHRLTKVFEANDTAFQLYNTRISRGGSVSACSGACKTTTICDIRAARAENNCDVTTPGTQLNSRDVRVGRNAHTDCSGGIGALFGGFVRRRWNDV